MANIKNTIAFFTCSNGFGHFSRVINIAKFLVDDYNVTIYCEKSQYLKFKPDIQAEFIFYAIPNIRWDKSINTNKVRFEEYLNWVDLYGPSSLKYDTVISDNIVGLLKFRKDTILTGSFLWRDVYLDKFGPNSITEFDDFFLELYNPVLCTNQYTETGTAKTYKNKFRTGFGFDHQKVNIWENCNKVVCIEPSLKYSKGYLQFQDDFRILIEDKTTYTASTDITITDECIYVIRPGVGMLTHCVENRIPIVALYSDNDSTEIMELGDMIEQLGIGIKHNIKLPFNVNKLSLLKQNTIYNNISFKTNGYRDISQFIIK